MRDFTFAAYRQLLQAAHESGYTPVTVLDYARGVDAEQPTLVLRHDVDRMPAQSVKMAELEHELGVRSSYYVRSTNGAFPVKAIKRMVKLGHEVGYHYETMARCNGDAAAAREMFRVELSALRELCEVLTITMHGSPMSDQDNRELWKHHDYRNFGLVAEPYFDFDFDRLLYITDAGRRWNDVRVNRRDMPTGGLRVQPMHTEEIIAGLRGDYEPHVLVSTHPHNWARNEAQRVWMQGFQESKNLVKQALLKRKR